MRVLSAKTIPHCGYEASDCVGPISIVVFERGTGRKQRLRGYVPSTKYLPTNESRLSSEDSISRWPSLPMRMYAGTLHDSMSG